MKYHKKYPAHSFLLFSSRMNVALNISTSEKKLLKNVVNLWSQNFSFLSSSLKNEIILTFQKHEFPTKLNISRSSLVHDIHLHTKLVLIFRYTFPSIEILKFFKKYFKFPFFTTTRMPVTKSHEQLLISFRESWNLIWFWKGRKQFSHSTESFKNVAVALFFLKWFLYGDSK